MVAAQNFEAMTHTRTERAALTKPFWLAKKSPDYTHIFFVLSYKGTSTENRISRTLEEKKDGEQLLLMYSKSNTCKAARKKKEQRRKEKKTRANIYRRNNF